MVPVNLVGSEHQSVLAAASTGSTAARLFSLQKFSNSAGYSSVGIKINPSWLQGREGQRCRGGRQAVLCSRCPAPLAWRGLTGVGRSGVLLLPVCKGTVGASPFFDPSGQKQRRFCVRDHHIQVGWMGWLLCITSRTIERMNKLKRLPWTIIKTYWVPMPHFHPQGEAFPDPFTRLQPPWSPPLPTRQSVQSVLLGPPTPRYGDSPAWVPPAAMHIRTPAAVPFQQL